MPRIPRSQLSGPIYHVLNRGNNKQGVFHKEEDYWAFVEVFKKAKQKWPLSVFAYCLMPNHFHFVVNLPETHYLSIWMQWLMTCHVRRYHKHYKSSGHIWQGRFKSFIIQRDKHLLTVIRYVEGNPVRAGLVSSAKEWIWSSHRERIGAKQKNLLDTLPIQLPSNWETCVDLDLTFSELDGLRQSVNQQSPYGDAEWVEDKKKGDRQL